MNQLEQQLLTAEVGAGEPRLRIRSGTHVDTGRWWRRSPVWLCVMDDELIMLAVARRRFFARIALRAAHASRYHYASGELVVGPGETLPLQRFKIPPGDALRILAFIQNASEERTDNREVTSC